MSLHRIILWAAAVGAVLGGVDYLLGGKWGLGKKFREAFDIMGPLALSMCGIIVLAPVLAGWLQPVLVPVFRLLRADPSLFAALIANDMGGYPLAMELAADEEMGRLAGCILASMLGCTLTYSIPLGLGILEKRHHGDFIQGLLLGLTTIPIGGVVGGLVAGYDVWDVVRNNIPIAAVSLALAAGFRFCPRVVTKLTKGFCAVIQVIAGIGLITGAFTKLTGVALPLLENADSLLSAMAVVAEIAIVLMGILPLLELLLRVTRRPLAALSRLLGVNTVSTGGLIYTLANPLPVFSMMKDMDARGRILNTAWLVTAAALLGDHLGFTSGVAPEMIAPMLIGRFIAAGCGLALALLTTSKMKERTEI